MRRLWSTAESSVQYPESQAVAIIATSNWRQIAIILIPDQIEILIPLSHIYTIDLIKLPIK